MPIHYGNTPIKRMFYGNTEIKRAFYGSTQVFPAAPAPPGQGVTGVITSGIVNSVNAQHQFGPGSINMTVHFTEIPAGQPAAYLHVSVAAGSSPNTTGVNIYGATSGGPGQTSITAGFSGNWGSGTHTIYAELRDPSNGVTLGTWTHTFIVP